MEVTPQRWQEVKKVLAGALDRTPEERSVYLDQACTEPALRREVESLIVAHEQGDSSFMERPSVRSDEMQKGVLKSGTKLGPYEILARIGAGGMGVVYRARDERLERDVAIKVLPVHLADRHELRERFEREARAIASLNHPHICTLHDVGHQDGTDYLVMEHLEGETLAQRLLKGSLPLNQVLQYATEIADALDKAHRKGVTHRDLKPGNIMLTKSGAKLLDFGLAKLRQETPPANVSLSKLSTEDGVTAQGTILGTLQYMAPEQLEAKQADARTDIFAFGVVVYEMATGKKAFEGKSQASLIAKILETDPPPMSSLQPMTPPALDRLVKKCLAKEPDKRWQAASDVCDELRWIAEGGSQVASVPTAQVKGIRERWRGALVWGVTSLLLAAVTGLAFWNRKPTSPHPVTRFTITLPPGQRLAGLERPVLALSPDGSQLAYVATSQAGGTQQIYLRAMDGMEARPIPGTEGAINPFFSPDGQWLGFFAGGKLKKISVNGGAALTLADAALPYGATWGNQGEIVIAGVGSVLQQVSDQGGALHALSRLEPGESGHVWPEFLPGSRVVVFSVVNPTWEIAVQPIDTGERRILIRGQPGIMPRYAPSGHLIFAQADNLMAAPFDLERLQVKGGAVPVLQGVLESSLSIGSPQYSVSATGTLVYVPENAQGFQSRLVWVSRNGIEQALGAPARFYNQPRLSPNGRRVAVDVRENVESSQVWLYDLTRDTLARFTFEGTNRHPVWTPDGRRIAFLSDREGAGRIFWQLADGSGRLERLTSATATTTTYDIPYSWSPDGQLLTFVRFTPTMEAEFWVAQVGDRKERRFLQIPSADDGAPQFSPDGHWLAYASDESGRREIYVQAFPGPGGKWQISTDGGNEPQWNRNGRELFYRSGDKMMAVDISTQPSFTAGKPRQLFEGHYLTTIRPFVRANYDVSPDGQRFLMLKPVEQEQPASTQINVVLNWSEELKRRVPAGTK